MVTKVPIHHWSVVNNISVCFKVFPSLYKSVKKKKNQLCGFNFFIKKESIIGCLRNNLLNLFKL